jgi:WXG100 family type VII secretion target
MTTIMADFEALDELVSTLKTAEAHVEQLLDALESEGNTLRDEWSGAAARAYESARVQWNAEMDEVRRQLKDAASFAHRSRAALADAEHTVTAIWG